MQTETRKQNISKGMKRYLGTEEGARSKQKSFIKRSKTMQQQKEIIRDSIQNKKCTKCTETKDVCKFGKKSDARDGYQSYCTVCILEIKRSKRMDKNLK